VTFDGRTNYEVMQRAKRESAKRSKTKRRKPWGLRRDEDVRDAAADDLLRRAWAERVGRANV